MKKITIFALLAGAAISTEVLAQAPKPPPTAAAAAAAAAALPAKEGILGVKTVEIGGMVSNSALRIIPEMVSARMEKEISALRDLKLTEDEKKAAFALEGMKALFVVKVYMKEEGTLEVTVPEIAAPFVMPVSPGVTELNVKPTFFVDALMGIHAPYKSNATIRLKNAQDEEVAVEHVVFWISSAENVSLAPGDVNTLPVLVMPYDKSVGILAGNIPYAGGKNGVFDWAQRMWNEMHRLGFQFRPMPTVGSGDELTTWQHALTMNELFTTRSGTCLDGALLWSSLAMRAGLNAQIIVMPGHVVVLVGRSVYQSPLQPYLSEIKQAAKKYKDGKEVKDPKATPAPVTGHEKYDKFSFPTTDFLHPYVLIETTAQGDRTGPTNKQEAVTLLNASLTGTRILADAIANHPGDIRIIDVKAWRDLGFGL